MQNSSWKHKRRRAEPDKENVRLQRRIYEMEDIIMFLKERIPCFDPIAFAAKARQMGLNADLLL